MNSKIKEIKERILDALDENQDGRVINIGTCKECGKSFQMRDYTNTYCQEHKSK